MCNPILAAGAQIFGGIMQSNAEEQSAAAKKNYYDYLAAQNDVQASKTIQRGEQQATSISETSAVDELNLNREAKRTMGTQRANLGASGVPSDSVTAEDIARDSNRTHQMDADALRFDADSKIWSARTAAADQAKALKDQAAQFRYAGANAKYAGDLNANTSLLGTATSVADTWYRYRQTSQGRTPPTVKTRGGPGGGYAMAPDYGNA